MCIPVVAGGYIAGPAEMAFLVAPIPSGKHAPGTKLSGTFLTMLQFGLDLHMQGFLVIFVTKTLNVESEIAC